MSWFLDLIVANPVASMTTVVAAVIAGYVGGALYSQYREEAALRAHLEVLKRERDRLRKDLQ